MADGDTSGEGATWNAHLEYLKVAISLASATLAVAAAVYSDASKVPSDGSKWMLLICAAFVLLTLVSSILAMARLANRVRLGKASKSAPGTVAFWASASFFMLVLSGVTLFAFFAWRTAIGGMDAQHAIEATQAVAEKQLRGGEALSLNALEFKADRYYVAFKISSTPPKSLTIVFDPKTNSILSISVQP